MKNRLLAIVTATGLAASLAFAQGPARRRAPAPGQPQHRLERIAQFLELTDAQKSQVQSILDAAALQRQTLGPKLRENRLAIQNLVKSGSPQIDAELETLAATQAALMKDLIVLEAKTHAQIYNLLTPEQRDKAEKLRGLLAPGSGGRGLGMRGRALPAI